MGGPTYHHIKKAPILTSMTMGGPTYHHVGKAQALTSTTMGGPTYNNVEKANVYLHLPDSSLPLGRNLDLKYTKLLSEVLKLHSN